MAKVNIEYDTKTKSCMASMDGAAIENLRGVHLQKSYSRRNGGTDAEGYSFRMHQHVHDKEHDLHHSHHTVADEDMGDNMSSGSAKATVVAHPQLEGYKLVIVEDKPVGDERSQAKAREDKAKADIVAFFDIDIVKE